MGVRESIAVSPAWIYPHRALKLGSV